MGFRDAISDVVRAVLRLLEERGATTIPTETRQTIEPTGPQQFSLPVEERLAPWLATARLFNDIQDLPESKALLALVAADEALASELLTDAGGDSVAGDDSRGYWLTNFTVMPVLNSYLEALGTVTWSEEVFDATISTYEEFLFEPTVPWSYVTFLSNFTMDADRFDLDEGVYIEAVGADELKRLFESSQTLSSSIATPDLLQWGFAIHVNRRLPKRFPSSQDETHLDVLTALRLHRAGGVGAAHTRIGPRAAVLGVTSGTAWLTTPERSFGTTYELSASGREDVARLFALLRERPDNKALNLALRRFNATYGRLGVEDPLIDAWVALEALLTPDSNQEVRYRASLRLATFLGETMEDRKSLFRQARDSYDVRSHVVHVITESASVLGPATEQTIELLRRVLRGWLDPVKPHDTDAIDDALLS